MIENKIHVKRKICSLVTLECVINITKINMNLSIVYVRELLHHHAQVFLKIIQEPCILKTPVTLSNPVPTALCYLTNQIYEKPKQKQFPVSFFP